MFLPKIIILKLLPNTLDHQVLDQHPPLFCLTDECPHFCYLVLFWGNMQFVHHESHLRRWEPNTLRDK